ncbi:MAG TPA: hypothetical protein VGR53_09510 [Nitrososphaerales archaeon]|nr:hypothetical protein [Nitrososphaerales archaeon]
MKTPTVGFLISVSGAYKAARTSYRLNSLRTQSNGDKSGQLLYVGFREGK